MSSSARSSRTVGAVRFLLTCEPGKLIQRQDSLGERDTHGDGKVIGRGGIRPENFNAPVTAMQTGRTG
jgi:hypothetical protein